MIQSIDYYAVAPLLLLVLTAGLVLLLDAFLPRRPYVRPLLGAVTLAGVLGALGVVLSQALRLQGPMRTFCVPSGLRSPATTGLGTLGLPPGTVPAPPLGVTPGPASMIFSGLPPGVTPSPISGIAPGPVSEVASVATSAIVPGLPPGVAPGPGAAPLFGSVSGAAPGSGPGGGDAVLCSFVVDHFTLIFAGLALAAGVVVVLLSMAELSSGEIPVGEWYFLLLCTLAGAVALPASRDLVMLVVALELASLPVFALTALKRYDGRSSEAAVKLFLVSVVSTAVMLLGSPSCTARPGPSTSIGWPGTCRGTSPGPPEVPARPPRCPRLPERPSAPTPPRSRSPLTCLPYSPWPRFWCSPDSPSRSRRCRSTRGRATSTRGLRSRSRRCSR